ncbi:MAG: hypothetical protein R2736_16535 [Solirubrobacterales bacterium]
MTASESREWLPAAFAIGGPGRRGGGRHRRLQEQDSDPLRPPGGLAITLRRRDDRALHQDVPLAREVLRVGNPGAAREILEELPDLREMCRGGTVDRIIAIGVLEQDVDERAALEARSTEPLVERIEDRQELLRRIRGPASHLHFKPIPCPQLLASLEKASTSSCWMRSGGTSSASPPLTAR